MTPEIFEDESDFIHLAAETTAKRLQCHVDLVYACMTGLDLSYTTPEHLERVKEVTGHLNEAARHARRLHSSLKRMTDTQRNDLLIAGCVTVFQVEYLASVLESDTFSLAGFSKAQDRTGGRNPAAYAVSELVRRIFRRQRRKITFGTDPNSDLPSTDFGWSVLNALGDFGIQIGWRGPAKDAHSKHRDIENRLARICQGRQKRLLSPEP